jgi:hypothetical protein
MSSIQQSRTSRKDSDIYHMRLRRTSESWKKTDATSRINRDEPTSSAIAQSTIKPSRRCHDCHGCTTETLARSRRSLSSRTPIRPAVQQHERQRSISESLIANANAIVTLGHRRHANNPAHIRNDLHGNAALSLWGSVATCFGCDVEELRCRWRWLPLDIHVAVHRLCQL